MKDVSLMVVKKEDLPKMIKTIQDAIAEVGQHQWSDILIHFEGVEIRSVEVS